MIYKCPFNYVGSKSNLIPILNKKFAQYKDFKFVDLFAGGFSIGANCPNKKVIFNDINSDLKKLIEIIYKEEILVFISKIEKLIEDYELSKQNKEGYIKLRQDFNSTRDSYLFCLLIFYSFNHQIRYNQKNEFNTPFGKDRSSFNMNIKKNLINFSELIKIKDIEFKSNDFNFVLNNADNNTLVYIDPPYLITTGSYNDGNRGVSSWNEMTEKQLYEVLDKLNNRGTKFVLSNMLKKGEVRNEILEKWSKKYKIEIVNTTYRNYHRKNEETIEIIVSNF